MKTSKTAIIKRIELLIKKYYAILSLCNTLKHATHKSRTFSIINKLRGLACKIQKGTIQSLTQEQIKLLLIK